MLKVYLEYQICSIIKPSYDSYLYLDGMSHIYIAKTLIWVALTLTLNDLSNLIKNNVHQN